MLDVVYYSTGEPTLQDLQDQWRSEVTGIAPEG